MNLARSNEVRYSYDWKKLLRVLIPITSVVVTAVSAFVIVLAELDLQTDASSPYWSILGVNVGLVLAFFGLNWDVYSDARRDVISMVAINIGALVPSTLTGLSTHQWGRVLGLQGLACVGFTWGWSLSRSVTRRYGIERSNLLSVVRTMFSMMLVVCATFVYILLHIVELEVSSP